MDSDMIFTGERFVPGLNDNKLETEHYQRYMSVCALVTGKAVLDAACGEGYGSNILASAAESVIGIDVDEHAVKHACQVYKDKHNLRFLQGSVGHLEIDDQSIDVVISFETIEHVDEKTQENFLREIYRVLKKDGILVMSTPNKKIYSDLRNYNNPFHIKEFYYDEFACFLKQYFQSVKMFNQSFQVTSIIEGDEISGKEVAYIKKDKMDARNAKYLIAVASNRSSTEQDISSVYAYDHSEYEANIERILTLQKEEEERNEHICELDKEIEEKNTLICNLKIQDEQKMERIRCQETAIQHQETTIQHQETTIQHQETTIQHQGTTIQHQETTIQQLNEKIEHQQTVIKKLELEKQKKLEKLEQELQNKEGHIELLLESERAYEREKNTFSYKLAKKIQKIGNIFFPFESKRRFFLRFTCHVFRHPRVMLHVIRPQRLKQYAHYLKTEGMDGVNKRYNDVVSAERQRMAGESHTLDIITSSEVSEDVVQSIEQYDRIVFKQELEPIVTIIIPVYNEFLYTYNCLQSIHKNSGDVAYEIIIANDCSTDLTSDIEQIVENIRLITTEKNVRFLLNCNHATQYARGKYILFLNNDTQVQPGWLVPLVSLLEADNTIGMAGSKLVYADGRLQEAGGILWKDGSAWNYGNRQPAENSEFNYVKEADYISGASIMIRSSLWKEIGGFDERFVPAYCEDSDLAFEVRKRGYKVMYQPLSVVVHFEGVSNGTDTAGGQKAYQIVNQKKFMEKWADTLQRNHFPNAENVFAARDRSRYKPVLLMIDHYVPQYDRDAGSRTVYQYLKLFVKKGYHVKFIGDNFFRHEPYTTDLQQMGIEVLYGPYYAKHWQEWIEENAKYIQYVFLNRPHISVKYIDFIRKKTDARIIYYGHDLHFLRELRNYELTGDKTALSESHKWKEKELKLMHKADIAYYPSEVEAAEIRRIDAQINVKAIVAYMFEDVEPEAYCFESRKDIMFIGGFVHTPNIDAVLWFAKDVFPIIKEKIPDIRFYVLGSHPTTEIQKLADDNILVKGFVSDEELEYYYRTCRISVVPLRYGAGIKGKVVEAMRYGMPVVTTSVGAEGIIGAEDILCIADQAEALGTELCALYNNEEKLMKMSAASYGYIRENFSEENAWRVIAEDFTKKEDKI